ncbi:MAG: hypothetical protein MUF21_11875 [Gemmatimonadaceae bacterium]|nr:hypothetical protein [Gemmatimonadaceae bacterium]
MSPVASCQRASPSLSRNLSAAPTSTAHAIVTPSWCPVSAAVMRSPAPTPVAATRMPGAMVASEGRVMRAR